MKGYLFLRSENEKLKEVYIYFPRKNEALGCYLNLGTFFIRRDHVYVEEMKKIAKRENSWKEYLQNRFENLTPSKLIPGLSYCQKEEVELTKEELKEIKYLWENKKPPKLDDRVTGLLKKLKVVCKIELPRFKT